MRPVGKGRLLLYLLLPLAGTAFFLWYIRAAGADAVYSDYIRLINEYLPDVKDPAKFLVPDLLTRIPACFVQRLINVKNFGYSVTFDRVCTVGGIALMAAVLARFAIRRKLRIRGYLAVMAVLFSLTKWEVLLNGTCWAHMAAIGLFFVNYAVFDVIWQGEADGLTELLACVMPFAWLLIAGEYIASYAVTMILLSGFGALTGGAVRVVGRKVRKVFLRILLSTLLALGLYLLSRSFAVWEHAGSTEMTLAELISLAPSFLPRFFLKSFAGAVIGQETLSAMFGGTIPDLLLLLLGTVMFLAYCVAFCMYFAGEMNEKTVFPLCLLLSGFLNHVLVTAGRWIFLNENYGLSSRYAGQFMVGQIGMLLIFALYRRPEARYRRHENRPLKQCMRIFAAVSVLLILSGSLLTTWSEIVKAPYRRANYEQMAAVIREYENFSAEELCGILEWHKDPADLTKALEILKENRLNVFRSSAAGSR